MTKSGASGPKAQQAAGGRYTQVRRTAPSSRSGSTVQFLLEDRYELGTLTVQIAAAWARQGMLVLLVHEYKPYGINMALHSRRVKERKAAERRRQQAWPGGTAAPCCGRPAPAGNRADCWSNSTPHGRLRPPNPISSPMTTTRSTTHCSWGAATSTPSYSWAARPGRTASSWTTSSYSPPATTPVTETLTHGAVPEERREQPLIPEQSAALLRERHLNFLYHRPTSFLGMITGSRELPAAEPEPGFVHAVEANMAAAGIPLLGHVHVSDHDLAAHTPHPPCRPRPRHRTGREDHHRPLVASRAGGFCSMNDGWPPVSGSPRPVAASRSPARDHRPRLCGAGCPYARNRLPEKDSGRRVNASSRQGCSAVLQSAGHLLTLRGRQGT